MWVLLALALIEMIVAHGLVAIWSTRVALWLSLVSLGGVAWIVRLIRSLRTLPPFVSGDVLTMRAGVLGTVAIPVASIAGLRADWSAETLRQRGTLNLGLLAYPNIVIDLLPPVMGRRGRPVRAVAHRLDDPQAFRAWIATLPQANGLA
ncbi:hypothetical protein [Sphingomonas montana]|uniref:hypothetical protein n=1 Tax=Sphingomonas montana TaxID=1843236 RepID=UPI001F0B6E02|nr:hypothetical protein [Sphingomonas montana]